MTKNMTEEEGGLCT